MEQEILKEISTNIIKWYSFKENSKILYIGNSRELKEYLEKNNKVEVVNSINEIIVKEMFDYIIIDIQENIVSNIEYLKQSIKHNGTLIFLLDNKFGITNFVTYNYRNQISPLEEKGNYENIKEICQKLKEVGFFVNKYMVFPDKYKTDMLINENLNDISTKLDKYFYNYSEDSVVLCNESDLLKNILKYDKELFKKLANSYFIEASLETIDNDVKYVSFNNYRKSKYRLITKIKENIVEKSEENSDSKIHIKDIVKNLPKLSIYNFKILDKYENNVLFSTLVKEVQTLDFDFANNYKNIEYIIEKLFEIKQELLNHSIKYEQIPNKKEMIMFKKENEDMLKELNFLEYAFYDMVPKNCFYINQEFYFFDQEWMEKYLPVEFIIYRSIINCYDLVKKINVDELFERLEILKYKKIFEETDNKIREKIIDLERLKICNKEYKKMYEIIYENKVLKQENENQRNLIDDYKTNNIKQDEYIKLLEKENIELKGKSKKKSFFQ